MPYLKIHVFSEPDSVLADKISKNITDLTAQLLNKDPDVTVIDLEFVSLQGGWYIAGERQQTHQSKTFYLNIKITKGSNTPEEKNRFIHEIYYTMSKLLGPINQASYVLIDEIDGNSWGYGGITQKSRIDNSNIKKL